MRTFCAAVLIRLRGDAFLRAVTALATVGTAITLALGAPALARRAAITLALAPGESFKKVFGETFAKFFGRLRGGEGVLTRALYTGLGGEGNLNGFMGVRRIFALTLGELFAL
jgi:hypothetical protein